MKTYCLKSIYYGHCEERQRRSNPRKNRDWPRRGWTRHFLGHFALGRFAPAGLAMTFQRRGQVIMEYAIIFSVVLAAIFATGIIDKTRDSFKIYLAKANNSMTVIRKGAEAEAGGREGVGGGEVAVGLETPGATDQPSQPREGQQEQGDPMAAVVKMNSGAKTELASLEDEYAVKKEKYDRIRAIPVIGWFMPEFAGTQDAQLMQVKIDAYRAVTDATTPLVEGNE